MTTTRTPYRTNATDLHDEELQAEQAELSRLVRDLRRRRIRVGVFLSVLIAGVSSAPFVYAAVRSPPPTLRCHAVEIQYENAPWLPHDRWTSCRRVP